MRIGIGIDTGGTNTDAVALDFDTKVIMGTSKALTTREDLSVGILAALDQLPPNLVHEAELVALSTSLATNACVEDKGGSAKLIFFGGYPDIIDNYGADYGLPSASEIYIQPSFTDIEGGREREPDWDKFKAAISAPENGFYGLGGVGIVELNAMRNGAVIEKKAKELFLQVHDTPVACGSELFSELNSLQRSSSTLLNARLFPEIQGFLNAINLALKERDVQAPVVVIRSDGSLMAEDYTYSCPVETLLCGPAASAIGSTYLAFEPNTVLVDMGGTTTDIAFIRNGVPVEVEGGVRIGKWRTFVNGLYFKTFGLGGDSAVHYYHNQFHLEDYQVVPLCVAATRYPQITENLQYLVDHPNKHTKFLHEHYILLKDITENPRYTEDEKAFCAALQEGPLILRKAAASIPGKDIYSLDVSRLLREGVVQLCGLTPTDIMHIKGDFTLFDTRTAKLAATFVARNIDSSVDQLCDMVYEEVRRRLYVNIVKALIENQDTYKARIRKETASISSTSISSSKTADVDLSDPSMEAELDRIINESYQMAKEGADYPYISLGFTTDFTLTGVGAPIRLFLGEVASLLGTTAVIPEHYEVANALGAIVSKVSVVKTVEIGPCWNEGEIEGYTVYSDEENQFFMELEEAERFALKQAKESARKEAIKRGAKGEITVTGSLSQNQAHARDKNVYLNSQVVAHAVGVFGL